MANRCPSAGREKIQPPKVKYVFIALELVEQNRTGIAGRLRRGLARLARPRLAPEEAEALGARYLLLRAPTSGEGPDWAAVAAAAGRFVDRMLLPDGLEPPAGSGIRPVRCPDFAVRVLLATACEIIRRTRMPMYRRVLGLIDPDAAYCHLLAPLLHHYTSVRVVTGKPWIYEAAAARVLAELGAPVLVGETLTADCVLALFPGGAGQFPGGAGQFPGGAGDFRVAAPCPVLVGPGCAPSSEWGPHLVRDLLSDPIPVLADEVAARSPAGIAPHRFAAALCDHAGVAPNAFGNLAAQSLLHNRRPRDLEEIVRMLGAG